MKHRRPFIIFDSVYLAVMLLCSMLYVFLDTGKAITGQLAILQLLFTVHAFIVFIICIRRGKVGLPLYIYILYSAAQLVPMFNWIWWYPTAFNLFTTMKMTFWVWFPIHTALLIYGVVAPIAIKKLKTEKGTQYAEE